MARRFIWMAAVLLSAFLTLSSAACVTGDDAEEDVPVPAGSIKRDSGPVDPGDVNDLSFKASDVRMALYTTTAGFDVTSDYYTDSVTLLRWEVVESYEYGDDDLIVILNKDKKVVLVNVMAGWTAKEQLDMFEETRLQFDTDDVAADGSVIVVTHYTCDEQDVEACFNLE